MAGLRQPSLHVLTDQPLIDCRSTAAETVRTELYFHVKDELPKTTDGRLFFPKFPLEFLYTQMHHLLSPCLCDPGDLHVFITIRVPQGRKKLGLCVCSCCFQIPPVFLLWPPFQVGVLQPPFRVLLGGNSVYPTLSTLQFLKLGHFFA